MTKQYLSKEEYRECLLKIIKSVDDTSIKVKFEKMLENSENYGKYHTTPSKIAFEIKDTGEKAFQRAILSSGKTLLNFKKDDGIKTVCWMDAELPVVFNENGRRSCIDLIGYLKETPTICELKFSDISSNGLKDSPIYAVIELLTYYCFIQYKVDDLHKHQVYHKNQVPFCWKVITKNPLLLICANKHYWDEWFKKRNCKEDLLEKVSLWSKELGASISLFQSDNFDFKKQKGGKEKYTPNLYGKNEWKKLY